MSIHSVPPALPATAHPHRAVIADLEDDFARMVDKAIGAILAGDPKPDAVFGAFAPFIAMARSVSYHEGKLLEAGIIRIAACNPDLMVMPQDRPMPIVPAALAFLERNEWSSLEGIRLRSDVHYRATYTPDLIVVNRKRHSALIMDIKRSLASYQERRLNALRNRMMAAALIGSMSNARHRPSRTSASPSSTERTRPAIPTAARSVLPASVSCWRSPEPARRWRISGRCLPCACVRNSSASAARRSHGRKGCADWSMPGPKTAKSIRTIPEAGRAVRSIP
jgi:hypothetical protein